MESSLNPRAGMTHLQVQNGSSRQQTIPKYSEQESAVVRFVGFFECMTNSIQSREKYIVNLHEPVLKLNNY